MTLILQHGDLLISTYEPEPHLIELRFKFNIIIGPHFQDVSNDARYHDENRGSTAR